MDSIIKDMLAYRIIGEHYINQTQEDSISQISSSLEYHWDGSITDKKDPFSGILNNRFLHNSDIDNMRDTVCFGRYMSVDEVGDPYGLSGPIIECIGSMRYRDQPTIIVVNNNSQRDMASKYSDPEAFLKTSRVDLRNFLKKIIDTSKIPSIRSIDIIDGTDLISEFNKNINPPNKLSLYGNKDFLISIADLNSFHYSRRDNFIVGLRANSFNVKSIRL